MAFSLANAMSGAGGAVADVGAEWGKTILREGAESRLMEQRGKQESSLMQERAKIEEMRIQRERDRVAKIGGEAEAARTAPAYDPATDSTRPQTPAEAANAAASVYNRNGMIAEAMRTREFEESRAARAEDRLDRRIDRTADNERADRQLTSQENHQKRMEARAGAAAELSKERFEWEKKQVELGKSPTTLADGSIGFVGIKEVDGKPTRQFIPLVGEDGKPVKGPKNMSESNKVFYAAQAKIAAEGTNEKASEDARKIMRAIEADPSADFTKTQGTFDNKGRPPLGSFMQGREPGAASRAPAALPAATVSAEERAVQSMSVAALAQAASKPDAIGAAAKRRLEQIRAQEADAKVRNQEAVESGIGFGGGA